MNERSVLTSCVWRICRWHVHYHHTQVWDSCRREKKLIQGWRHTHAQTHTYARSCWLCSNRGTSAFITDLESSQCPPGRWLTRLHISYFILYIALWLLHLGPQPVKSHKGKHPSLELLLRLSKGSDQQTSILVINIKLDRLVTLLLIAFKYSLSTYLTGSCVCLSVLTVLKCEACFHATHTNTVKVKQQRNCLFFAFSLKRTTRELTNFVLFIFMYNLIYTFPFKSLGWITFFLNSLFSKDTLNLW